MPDKKDDKKPGIKLHDLIPRKDAKGGRLGRGDGNTGANGKIGADAKVGAESKVQTDRFI